MPIKGRSCIVIGAGLAGLSAAYRLRSRGWKVTVLEALERLGGRVFSYRFEEAPKLVCELGGEWIGAQHKAIRRLCKEFDLKLARHRYAFSFWNGGAPPTKVFNPGQWCFSTSAKKNFKQFKQRFWQYDSAQVQDLDQFDWWSVLGTLGFTAEELRQRDLMDSTDFGETIRLTSAYSAAAEYIDSNDTDAMDFKIRGGNSLLPYALAGELDPKEVYRGTKVRAVHQTATGVKVFVHGRRSPFRAEFCICSVPAHCLLKINWQPALPEEQAAAARQLQYSRIMKTAVLFNKRFWKKHNGFGFSTFTTRISDFCFDSTYLQRGKKMGILCSYSIGDKADDLASEPHRTNVKKWIREDMVKVTKPEKPHEIKAINAQPQAWQKVPWIGGAYAFYRPGQWFKVRPILQRAHGRVLFAGEHLADLQGFMEGAVNTGEAAADQL
jgi:monoamine oxidase